jgi:hypothetical protein
MCVHDQYMDQYVIYISSDDVCECYGCDDECEECEQLRHILEKNNNKNLCKLIISYMRKTLCTMCRCMTLSLCFVFFLVFNAIMNKLNIGIYRDI